MTLGDLAAEKSSLITDITRVQHQVNSLRVQFANVLGRAPPPGATPAATQQHTQDKNNVKHQITQALPLHGANVTGFATREDNIQTQLNQIITPLQQLMALLTTQRDALNQVSQQMANPNLGNDDQHILAFLQQLETDLENAAETNRTIWISLNGLS